MIRDKSFLDKERMSILLIKTEPLHFSSLQTAFIREDFPQPLGPAIPQKEPFSILRSRFFIMFFRYYRKNSDCGYLSYKGRSFSERVHLKLHHRKNHEEYLPF